MGFIVDCFYDLDGIGGNLGPINDPKTSCDGCGHRVIGARSIREQEGAVICSACRALSVSVDGKYVPCYEILDGEFISRWIDWETKKVVERRRKIVTKT